MHSKSFTATMRRMALLIGGTALHILLGQTRLSIGANELEADEHTTFSTLTLVRRRSSSFYPERASEITIVCTPR